MTHPFDADRRRLLRAALSAGSLAPLATLSLAATTVPGVVFHASGDGWLRARSTVDGEVLWRFDTAQPVQARNGVEARGGQLHGWVAVAVDGALYVVSGASAQGEPGNALLVFRVKSD